MHIPIILWQSIEAGPQQTSQVAYYFRLKMMFLLHCQFSKVGIHFLPYPWIRSSYMTYTGFDIQYLIPNLFITFFYDSWVAFFSVKDGGGGICSSAERNI